jgi:hypothetical protein
MSWKCNPVVGSSNTNNALSLVAPLTRKEANLIRWDSWQVEED